MKEVAVSEKNEGGYVSPECFHAYISAETKVPNTLIAVGPYVGHAALKSLPASADITTAVKQFANTYRFSRHQMDSAIKTVVSVHGRFGVLVLPADADLKEKEGVKIFKQERFEVVYMEGVMNILEAILRLHGVQSKKDGSRDSQVAELLEHPDKLATTIAVFAAAEHAINSLEASDKSNVFREKFNFIRTGEKSRGMAPVEKIAIQTETMPFIIEAARQILAERQLDISDEQLKKFVYILTSPELCEDVTEHFKCRHS